MKPKLLLIILTLLYAIRYTLYAFPTYATTGTLNLSDEFGYGHINTLGEGLGFLVVPGFGIAGLAVGLYFIFGAFKYLTSGGNPESVKAARATITHAIIGFLLLLFVFILFEILPQILGLVGFRIIGP